MNVNNGFVAPYRHEFHVLLGLQTERCEKRGQLLLATAAVSRDDSTDSLATKHSFATYPWGYSHISTPITGKIIPIEICMGSIKSSILNIAREDVQLVSATLVKIIEWTTDSRGAICSQRTMTQIFTFSPRTLYLFHALRAWTL
jgi:hypothetical protein